MPIRVLLADDSGVVRTAIVRLLKDEPKIELIGDASNFADTLEKINRLEPDVLLLDIHMPDQYRFGVDSISAALRKVKRIFAISVWNDEGTRVLAKCLGAQAVLDKFQLGDQLIPAILTECRSKSEAV